MAAPLALRAAPRDAIAREPREDHVQIRRAALIVAVLGLPRAVAVQVRGLDVCEEGVRVQPARAVLRLQRSPRPRREAAELVGRQIQHAERGQTEEGARELGELVLEPELVQSGEGGQSSMHLKMSGICVV
eukprot:3849581-Rhodomonas_salina.1